jgi:multiple sugar transport system ATP-binding protein
MASVTYDHVFKRFGEVTAVNNMNLEIIDKEFLVLVGPSGCGKTTALRLLAGLEEISEGTISIEDRVVNDVAPKDRDIAMVFQSYALYPHMSVYDNMAFGLKLRKTPKDEIKRRVGEAAQILGIEHLLDRKPRQLSGGQRQRVAVGRAIVREPKVFRSMNRFRIWMQSCGFRPAPKLPSCISDCRQPLSTLPTIRSKP